MAINNTSLFLIAIFVVLGTSQVLAARQRQVTVTTGRQAYTQWVTCNVDNICDEVSISAYEQDTRTGGPGRPHETPTQSYLYYYHYHYDQPAGTYTVNWLQQNTPLTGFTYARNGRSASLVMSGLVDNNGNNVALNVTWDGVIYNSECDCKTISHGGPVSFTTTSDSASIQTNVTGSVTDSSVVYTSVNSNGWLYDYGAKETVFTYHN